MNIKHFLYLSLSILFFSVFTNSFFISNSNPNGCLKARQLTNQDNRHSRTVMKIKASSDSKRVISVGTDGQVKYWNLISNNLILKQTWYLNEGAMNWGESLVFWQDGKKIFIGGNSGYVKIYQFKQQQGLYDTSNYQNISVTKGLRTWIMSVYVNQMGNQMYVGFYDRGLGVLRYIYDGTNWKQNTPEGLQKQIGVNGSKITFISKTKDERKLMVYFRGVQSNNSMLKIFNSYQGDFILDQTIMVSYSQFISNCRLSKDDRFVIFFGAKLLHRMWAFDVNSNKYVDVSDKQKRPVDVIADANIDLTNSMLIQAYFLGDDDFGLDQYKLDFTDPFNPKYTLNDEIRFVNKQDRPFQFVLEATSKFYLVGTGYQDNVAPHKGKIFLVSCYQQGNDIHGQQK